MIENEGAAQPRDGKGHYDTEFKLRVIAEIESGELSAWGARRKYNIPGKMTVHRWLRRFGKAHLLGKGNERRTDYLSMSRNSDKLDELKKRNTALESALADAQIRALALESLVEAADEHYATNLKKNFGSQALKKLGKIRRGETYP